MRTTVNAAFVREVKWRIQLNENQIGERAGFSPGYIYRLLDEEGASSDVKLSTVDRLYEAIAGRMLELKIAPPDDLWESLIRHEL